MPLADRPPSALPPAASALFVNRVEESRAVRDSVAAIRTTLRDDTLDPDSVRNVLMFYGIGGVGKTRLSVRIEKWLRGEVADAEWGVPPTGPIATCRWDLNRSAGDISDLDALIALRSGLLTLPHVTWEAFDLALIAYHQSVRPGAPLTLRTADGTAANTLMDVLQGLAGDLGAMDVATGLGAAAIRQVVSLARKHRERSKALAQYAALDDILARIPMESSPGCEDHDLAADLAWLLTLRIDKLPGPERPTVVVFVDHAEKLQGNNRRDGEVALNALAARLPYVLFIVTGRNALDWCDATRTALPFRGPQRWPGLDLLSTADPRQHRLGNLSPHDGARLISARCEAEGIDLTPFMRQEIYRVTGGWPLHIDALLRLAAQPPAGQDTPLTPSDLNAPFDDVVLRIMEGLDTDEARAFRAACMLPAFDIALVAQMANVDSGVVRRCLARTLVEPNNASSAPYRIHDAVRHVVLTASSERTGGWDRDDWRAVAARGVAAIEVRYKEALAADDLIGAVRELAAAITLSADHGTYAPWLAKALITVPSHRALARLVPVGGPATDPQSQDLLDFLRARSLPRGSDEALDAFAEITRRGGECAGRAGLWRAYGLRVQGRFDEAVEQLVELRRTHPARQSLYRRQTGVTLIAARRFRQAIAMEAELTDSQIEANRELIARRHGHTDGAEVIARRINRNTSRQFRNELRTTVLLVRSRAGEDITAEAEDLLETSLSLGLRGDARLCLGLLAAHDLGATPRFEELIEEYHSLADSPQEPTKRIVPELRALRALATRDPHDIDLALRAVAGAKHASSSWIPTEMYLAELGHPLDPRPTEWLEPYEDVRARWLAVADTMIRASMLGDGH